MTIRAIAFDLDGTLCHTLPDLIAAANASRAHMGLAPLPDATIESYIGDGIPRLVHRVLTNSRDGDADAPPAEHAEAYRYFTAYYLEHLSDKTRPYPQVPETLAALQQDPATRADYLIERFDELLNLIHPKLK